MDIPFKIVTIIKNNHLRNKKEMETTKRLYRDSQNRLIGGVCSGLGDYFNVDFSIIRIIWLLLFLFGGIGLLAYIIAWIVVPEKPL